jgi:hypothetical protein
VQIKLAEKGELEKPPMTVFNTVVNACEICGEHELTLAVLDAMRKTHQTEGNIITFNIALKRLARMGNPGACEGIIIGMLQSGVEPSVVSYTTAIAACAAMKPTKDYKQAYEWLKRMRSRNIMPSVVTYNTALATCLGGESSLEATMLASKIAAEMMKDVEAQVEGGPTEGNVYTSVLPDTYTKSLARQLMKQLRENWRSGDIDMKVAKATVRVPLLKLVDFEKSEIASKAKEQTDEAKSKRDEGELEVTERDEVELEYKTTASTHRIAEV